MALDLIRLPAEPAALPQTAMASTPADKAVTMRPVRMAAADGFNSRTHEENDMKFLAVVGAIAILAAVYYGIQYGLKIYRAGRPSPQPKPPMGDRGRDG